MVTTTLLYLIKTMMHCIETKCDHEVVCSIFLSFCLVSLKSQLKFSRSCHHLFIRYKIKKSEKVVAGHNSFFNFRLFETFSCVIKYKIASQPVLPKWVFIPFCQNERRSGGRIRTVFLTNCFNLLFNKIVYHMHKNSFQTIHFIIISITVTM